MMRRSVICLLFMLLALPMLASCTTAQSKAVEISPTQAAAPATDTPAPTATPVPPTPPPPPPPSSTPPPATILNAHPRAYP